MPARVLKRLRRHARALIRPKHQLRALEIGFSHDHPGAERLLKWAPDWKTDLICRALSHRPGIFLDVGANVGQTMLDYLSCPARTGYIGFEPNPRAYAGIQTLIRQNGLADCAIVPTALAEVAGILPLYLREGSAVDGSASVVTDLRPTQQRRAEYISSHRADDILPPLVEEKSVTLVKVDVEGAELLVLKGMPRLLESGPWIVCEVLGRDPHAEADPYRRRISELMSLLSGAGYAVLHIGKQPGNKRVRDLTPISAFPDVVWSPENQHEFDYFFVPADQAAQAQGLF